MSVAAALRVMDAALDYLNGPGAGEVEAAALGDVLESLAGLSGKLAAARSAILSRFDAARGHAADGYGSSAAWLAAKGRVTRRAAGAEVRRMRVFRQHPVIAAAVAAGDGGGDRRLDLPAPRQLARRHRHAPRRHRLRRRGPRRPRRHRPGRL
jgi:hypothetical protein